MKKRLVLLLFALLILLLPSCGPSGTVRDFYSMERREPGQKEGVMWLGMTKDEQWAATGSDLSAGSMARVRYRDGTLQSMTAISKFFRPLGMRWDMKRDDIKAIFAKDPEVTVTEEPQLLTAAKTINGIVYYTRVAFYDDGVIKLFNQTTDLSMDSMEMP